MVVHHGWRHGRRRGRADAHILLDEKAEQDGTRSGYLQGLSDNDLLALVRPHHLISRAAGASREEVGWSAELGLQVLLVGYWVDK